MPSYYESQAGMMGQLLPMLQGQRRLADAQQEREFNRRLHMQNLQRQYDALGQQGAIQGRRLDLSTEDQRRKNLEFENQIRNQGRTFELRQQEGRERERAALQRERGPLKPGYTWSKENPMEQVEVPYGPAWEKSQTLFAKDTAAVKNMQDSYSRLEEQAKLALGAKLSRITGLTGIIPNIPGQAGSVAAGRLEGLKDMITIDTMRMLKDLSTTGATGFGQLSEKEGMRLEGYLGNLRTATSEEELRRVVKEVKAFAAGAKNRALEDYKQRHATRIGVPGARGKAGSAGQEVNEAKAAIAGGADAARVRARYKERTGLDLPE